MELISQARDLLSALISKGLTLATAESCTGGNIAHQVTLIPGSSAAFMGGAITYSNEAKQRVLGVDPTTLEEFGAVSEQVVVQMANGAAHLFNSDCAVATSGIAGPGGGTPGKPVGTVWMAITTPNGTVANCLHLSGSREEIINQTTEIALRKLLQEI